jgi:hypothetical protein
MRKLPDDIIVLVDSREQKPWEFKEETKEPGKIRIAGSEIVGLNAADYSLKGYEDIIRIERKRGFAELMGNMCPKDHKLRFEREMEKLRLIPHKYLLIETVPTHDALSLGVPQSRFGPPCSAIIKWLNEIEIEYGIHVQFVGECGKRIARSIFETIVRKYHDRT